METEAHVYAFSMAANVLLSLFPFFIVMVSICRHLLHWEAAEQAIYLALQDLFPGTIGEFIPRNLRRVVGQHGALQFTSLFLLLFTANGIFEPLEVALNRAWGIAKNRSFVRNQLVSMGLIFVCGGLAFISFLLTALNQQILRSIGLGDSVVWWLGLAVFKMIAVPISVVALFLVYWRLPNGKVAPEKLIGVSVAVGVVLEVLKYVSIVVAPALSHKLDREYGPFEYPVTIILWSFIASMIVLAGADYAARSAREGLQSKLLFNSVGEPASPAAPESSQEGVEHAPQQQ
jgi:uncharacterized BrkB/YihY/UPF0761 family membrane protein